MVVGLRVAVLGKIPMLATCDVPAAPKDLPALNVRRITVHVAEATGALHARWGLGAFDEPECHVAVWTERVIVPVDSGVVAVLRKALVAIPQVTVANDMSLEVCVHIPTSKVEPCSVRASAGRGA